MEEKKHRLLTRTPPGTPPGSESGAERTPHSASARGTHTVSVRVKPMSTPSLIWRIGVTVLALAILTAGQFLNTNDFFPLGSLTQYATAKDLNGTVNSTCIAAAFPGEDEPRRLAFNTATVGIERGDVESQLQRVIDHPELLQTLADSYIRLHPGRPEPERMILCRETTQLEGGYRVGEPEQTILAEWEVR